MTPSTRAFALGSTVQTNHLSVRSGIDIRLTKAGSAFTTSRAWISVTASERPSRGASHRPGHELAALGEADPGPAAAAALDERGDDRAQDVVGVAAAIEDPVDGVDGAAACVRAHPARPSPSK